MEAGIWKALSDPTRRSILDLLRERPRTTGELAGEFKEVTRFSIMKHLGVLEDAGLIVVRRSGRERWNHLNAVPLQEIYERWMSPFSEHWARSLWGLKRISEAKVGEEMAVMEQGQATQVKALHISQETTVEAPRKKVFEALTNDIAYWWGAPFLIGSDVKDIVLEPRLGGALKEVWGDGQGAIWCTVTEIRQNELIELAGGMGMGGALAGLVRFELEELGGSTIVKLDHKALGLLSDEAQANYTGGWKELIDNRLRAFVERGEKLGLKA